VVAAAVEEPPRAAPPASPAPGSCYLIAANPSGAWAGHADELAAFTVAGWRFIVPVEGMSAFVRDSGLRASFRSGGWEIGVVNASALSVGGQQVVGSQRPPIAAPAGGSSVDAECRNALEQILTALRGHGLIGT
jgi:hypothetical protein